ncbi:hypothetical protein IKE83_00630 [Candidatus Saccharibacteria bacterium]|nr:hypothetical protein [Candidatus Saccharibacteria bacterium]
MNQKQREWDEYFMKIAATVATKSKDPSSKTAALLSMRTSASFLSAIMVCSRALTSPK